MSPYEIIQPGGSVEHWNEEAGNVWIDRLDRAFPPHRLAEPDAGSRRWAAHQSVGGPHELMEQRMFPLTLGGIDEDDPGAQPVAGGAVGALQDKPDPNPSVIPAA